MSSLHIVPAESVGISDYDRETVERIAPVFTGPVQSPLYQPMHATLQAVLLALRHCSSFPTLHQCATGAPGFTVKRALDFRGDDSGCHCAGVETIVRGCLAAQPMSPARIVVAPHASRSKERRPAGALLGMKSTVSLGVM